MKARGMKARLYGNRTPQPVLVVNDLKQGDTEGAVALWVGVGTDSHSDTTPLASLRDTLYARRPV